MLLIATNRDELAADYLILRLRERGLPFCRFNTETLGDSADLEITCDDQGPAFSLLIDNHGEVAHRIKSVYFHHALAPLSTPEAPSDQKEFAARELLETLRSLWRLIPERKWLNHPIRLWRAANKVEQLAVARGSGLPIPDTLITRRERSVRDFLRRHRNNVVAKAVRHGFVIGDNEMLLAGTQRIGPEYPDLMDRFADVPVVYQEAIAKGADVRVVVVDSRAFAVEIMAAGNHIDWRVADITGNDLGYELVNLPSSIEQSCVEIVGKFGLRYSSMDLVRAQDGRFVFYSFTTPTWVVVLVAIPLALVVALLDLVFERYSGFWMWSDKTTAGE